MKRIYKIFAIAAVVMAAAGCVKEQFEPEVIEVETVEDGEGAVVGAYLPSTADTKVSHTMDAANKLIKTAWEKNDTIHYYQIYGTGMFFQQDSISTDGKFTQFANANARLYSNTNMIFSYPVAYKNSSGGNIRIQNLDGTWEYTMKNMDYLYGFVTTDSKKVIPNIEFKRTTAFLEIKDLSFPADVNATIKTIYVMSPSMGNRTTFDINKSTATVYRDATIVIQPEDYKIVNGKVEGDKVIYGAFMPTAEAAAGDKCQLMFQTEDGTMYEKTWTASSKYTPGNMYTVTGDVTKPIAFNIEFADPDVKASLVYYGVDKNGDGEISNLEAQVVTTLGWMFSGYSWLDTFNEFQYFTGVTTFDANNSGTSGGFYNCVNLKEITLPSSITLIGSDAFNGCTSLEKFVVPESVKRINAGAFRNCTALKDITIPSTVEYMGEGQTFRGCTALKTLTWPSSTTTINASMFQDSGLETFTIPENITEIGNSAFEGCTALKTITIPASVKKIGQAAFKGCTGISTFAVPSGLETIGNESFYGTGATSFTIPASVTSIGQKAFNSNPNITSFTIEEGSAYFVSEDVSMVAKTSGETVEAISFFGNKTEITFPENVTKIGNYFAQGSPDLEKVNIPAVSSLGTGVFMDCPKLTTAVYAAEATTTGNNTFQNCTSLVNVTLPEAITQIGSNLFSGCTALKTLSIPSGVSKINSNAFSNCSSLEELSLPSALTEIVSNLFMGCTSLKKIEIPSSVKKIGNSAFSGCVALTELNLPESITEIPSAMIENCTGIKTITIPESVTKINSNAFKGSGLTSFTFPSKVTTIASNTFANCADLKSVTIPSTITKIDMWAFSGCGIESITIPEGIKEVTMYSFQNCANLATVTIPSTVTKIAMYAFDGCSSLKTVNWPATPALTIIDQNAFKKNTSLESITIPASVTKLGNSVFDGCTNLKNVTLSEGLTTIGVWTFQNCTSLKSITIPASVNSYGSSIWNGCTALEEVIILSTTPCNISANVFPFATNDDLVIYVPDSAIDAYKAHASWSVEQFAGRIFAISTRQ